ncbi:hypothetical protein M9H77_12478 [Catharanthus roseus]|uniref:Uncharacterized protein n=1 Tax=Catharanthus roseus TaxID=4058 RepID=A0ACC0BHQ2_CATRO|nr:hypothetical protein M9H77_12478 [Catharanthus roseus]
MLGRFTLDLDPVDRGCNTVEGLGSRRYHALRMGLVVAILGGLVPPLCERCNDIILGLLRRLACLDEECKVARKSMETLVCADIFLANSSLEDLCLNEAVEEVFVFWGLTEFGTEVVLLQIKQNIVIPKANTKHPNAIRKLTQNIQNVHKEAQLGSPSTTPSSKLTPASPTISCALVLSNAIAALTELLATTPAKSSDPHSSISPSIGPTSTSTLCDPYTTSTSVSNSFHPTLGTKT